MIGNSVAPSSRLRDRVRVRLRVRLRLGLRLRLRLRERRRASLQSRRLGPRPAGSPEASLTARPRLRPPQDAASLGQSAGWGRAGTKASSGRVVLPT
jgi:hypothetical protein